MGVIDDNDIKLNGNLLVGIIKSLEIKGSAIVEELEVEGKGKKPIQATGFEDSSINLDLILLDDVNGKTKEEKLQSIQDIFKTKNQKIPNIYNIVNKYINQRGIYKVIVKEFSSKLANNKSEIAVTLTFREYESIAIKVSKKSNATNSNFKTNSKKSSEIDSNSKNNSKKSNIINYDNQDWLNYLNGDRGLAPSNVSQGRSDPFKNSPVSPYFGDKGKK